MSLSTILLGVGIAALVLTILMKSSGDRVKNILLSYIQNFCGGLFIFSGLVKAVDPLGTAYKMQDYFAQFEIHFSFIGGIFAPLSEMAVGIAVFMIVFEIVLGVMLILGTWPKTTSISFFLLVLFFTILTGFTYLTGHIPRDATFFEFNRWYDWKESNMLVTDCGCFGDFIVLKPFVSFMKDVVLMVPAIIFLIFSKKMHQISTTGVRFIIPLVTTLGMIVYCMSNYVWDLPHEDFRPFREGVNIAKQKQAEEDAMANVSILGFKLTNKADGKVVELGPNDYAKMKNYPKAEWNYEQIKSEPTMTPSKISEFEIDDNDNNIADDLLANPDYNFMIVGYKLPYKSKEVSRVINDTIFRTDTIALEEFPDSIHTVQVVDKVNQENKMVKEYTFDANYLKNFKKVSDFTEKAAAENVKSFFVTKFVDRTVTQSLKEQTHFGSPIYMADDILLKTIVRSNPGVVLMKEGLIIKKWHINKLPKFDEIKSLYLK